LLLLLRPLIVAFFCGWSNRSDRRGDLLIGIGVGLLIVCIHSFFEWIFVLSETQYMFAMQIGLVAGLAQQLGYWPNRAKALGPKNVKIPGRSSATSDQEHQDRVLIGRHGIVGRKKKIT
jgi:hypothetical protein